MSQILLDHLSKRFGKEQILNDISLQLESGNIYGIIGRNGSGKTVLLKLICGLLRPTSGKITYNGETLGDRIKILPNTGVILNRPEFFEELSAYQNLELLAKLKKIISKEEICEVIQKVGLENDNKPVSKYSLGMKQRLGIAQAIMEHPDHLILDEFSNGLDEEGIKMIHSILRSEAQKGKLIVITSHHQEDIVSLCDHVYRLKEGGLYNEA